MENPFNDNAKLMMAFTVELSMVLVLIPRIIFSFCEMDFIDYFVSYGGIHEYFWQENLNHWWYSWNSVKKNETFRAAGWAFGPRFRPPIQPPLRPLGPADSPKSSVFLFYRISWNHLWFHFFLPKNIRETTKSDQINQWNQVTKKLHGSYIKPIHFCY